MIWKISFWVFILLYKIMKLFNVCLNVNHSHIFLTVYIKKNGNTLARCCWMLVVYNLKNRKCYIDVFLSRYIFIHIYERYVTLQGYALHTLSYNHFLIYGKLYNKRFIFFCSTCIAQPYHSWWKKERLFAVPQFLSTLRHRNFSTKNLVKFEVLYLFCSLCPAYYVLRTLYMHCHLRRFIR